MADVTLSSIAEADFTESLCWYAKRSAEAANDFDSELAFALTQIASAPDRYPFCDNRHRYFMMRRFPFQIIYRSINQEIVVIAIAHASRSPDF